MNASAVPTSASPAATVSSRTGTTFATDPALAQAGYTDTANYSQAVASSQYGGQPAGATTGSTAGAAGQPVQWDDSIRQQFRALGLTANQVAQVEALGLSAQDLQQAYTTIAQNPSVAQQIPDTPPAANAGTGNNTSGGGGQGQQGMGTPTGPAAWSDEWATKFREAGAPPDLLQQLTFTGAMGADATQLQQSLDQLKQTVDTEISKFREKYPKAYDKLSEAKMDKATLYQVAAAVNSGQITQDQFQQIVDQAGMTPGKMIKDLVVKQILPWTLIPGWGAIRFALSPFFGGKDPISGEDIHLDFWNHGFTGWMDAAMAAGGVMSLAMSVRGGLQLFKGIQAIDAAKGADLVGSVAKAENLVGESGTMSLGKKIMSFLPGSSENRAVTGIARLPELEKGVGLLPEGSVARTSLQNYLDMLKNGDAKIGSKAGWGSVPFGLGNDSRGALPIIGRRNKPMVDILTKDGSAVMNLDGRLTGGPELTAHVAANSIEFQSPAKIADMMKQYGVTSIDALKTRVLAEAGTALGMGEQASNPLRTAMGILRPGPVDDVLKAIANKPPSAAMQMLKNPWVKFLGIGAASAGAMLLMKHMMGGGAADQAQQGQDQQAQAQGQAGAGGQFQLTAQDQQQIQQFLAMTPDQQRQFAAQAAQQLQQAASQQLTPDQQAELDHEAQVLQLMVQYAQQQGGTAAGATTSTGSVPTGSSTAYTQGMNLGLGSSTPQPGMTAGTATGGGQPVAAPIGGTGY